MEFIPEAVDDVIGRKCKSLVFKYLSIRTIMSQVKAITIRKTVVLVIAQFAALVGLATMAPLLNQQAVTGPIVNATLFIAVMFLDIQSAVLVGLIPSTIALSMGLLPVVLAPMVPFIMVGNTILVVAFSHLRKKNYWLGIVSASVLKYVFLFSTSTIVMDLLLKKEIAAKVAVIMSWPQLLTALAGGVLAYGFCRVTYSRLNNDGEM